MPDDDYERFLKEWTKGDFGKTLSQMKTGPIYDLDKKKLGEHKGIAFYTIGQRKGLNIALGKPLYVVKIDHEENAIYVGENNDLFRKAFVVSDLNWISIPQLEDKMECLVKIRYLHTPAKATILPYAGNVGTGLVPVRNEDRTTTRVVPTKSPWGKVKVIFERPERAITPGQSAVFYEGERVIGGGIIEGVLD